MTEPRTGLRTGGRTVDMLLVFFLGAIMGFLTSFSTFSGRLATIEANQTTSKAAIDRLDVQLQQLTGGRK